MQVPAHVQTYVQILGEDLAVDFLLKFGGAPLYLAKDPKRAEYVELIGVERAALLADVLGAGTHVKPPLAKPWIIHKLAERGLARKQIARLVHMDESSVRRIFAAERDRQAQLDLF